VVNHTPLSHAVELGAERIYVLRVPRPARHAPSTAVDVAMHALAAGAERRFAEDVARYDGVVDLVLLPAPDRAGVRPTDFARTETLIDAGRAACLRRLAGDPVPAAA